MSLQGCHLCWNCAQRRRHSQAKALVIHLYAGGSYKEWDHGWPSGLEVVTLDVLNGQNVHNPATWSYIWGLAGSGKVIAVIGGPPCRSVSRMLEKQPGPPRLRGRNGADRFGLSNLTDAQQQKTDGDTAMFLKHRIYMHAEESWDPKTWPHMELVQNRVGFLLESPEDPKAYLQNGAGDESASFWAWDETLSFLSKYEHVGMKIFSFDQGAFGHVRKNPRHACRTCPI